MSGIGRELSLAELEDRVAGIIELTVPLDLVEDPDSEINDLDLDGGRSTNDVHDRGRAAGVILRVVEDLREAVHADREDVRRHGSDHGSDELPPDGVFVRL